MTLIRAAARQCSQLLYSSRPAWAGIPGYAATHFVETLFYTLSTLEHCNVKYVAHFGILLGAARLGGMLPWDEDADIFVIGETPESLLAKIGSEITQLGLSLTWRANGYYLVRQKPWIAAQGHVALEFLPPVIADASPRTIESWESTMTFQELLPRAKVPFHGSWVWAPGRYESVLTRIYADSGSPATMARFRAPALAPESVEFWAHARADELKWDAIVGRATARPGWHHLTTMPWWWFNGAYNIAIGRLRRAGQRWQAANPGT